MKKIRAIFIFCLCLCSSAAYPALNLVLTQGVDSAIPIAVVPFSGESQSSDNNSMVSVITQDLHNSGRFNPLAIDAMPERPDQSSNVKSDLWKDSHVDYLIVGHTESAGGNQIRVKTQLISLYPTPNVRWQDTFTIDKSHQRTLAHHIADKIYQKLMGVRGVFSTRLAYVLIQTDAQKKSRYALMVSDADGFNPRPILRSSEPIMSPAWSPNGKKIAYVSFENNRAQIYVSDIASGSRELITHYPGINGAPAFSPNGQELAMVLSKSGSPKIYIFNLNSKQLRQITQGNSIDTEPTFTPDGKSIVFTSDRAGSPQLFQVNLRSNALERLTFSGRYNAHANFSADGKQLMMMHGDSDGYNVAIQDTSNGKLTLITQSGRNDSPSLSPNSSMVLYGTEFGELGLVSTDGRINLRLPAGDGQVRSPAWSPYLTEN